MFFNFWLLCCWDDLLIDFWLIFDWFWGRKSIKNQSKKGSKIRCKLGCILDGSWIDLGAILGPSWEAKWGQVGTKIWKMGSQDDVKKWALKHERGPRRITQVMGGWVPINNTIHHSRAGHGALDSPHRATRARWRITKHTKNDQQI